MKVLVVGGGGREHALVWKINQSLKTEAIYCAPGNAGIAELAECISIKPDEVDKLLDFALKENIDITIVGPEAPLVEGIVDLFESEGLAVVGPTKSGARLEGSKVFAKEFMFKYKIPTASFEVFENSETAKNYILNRDMPCVIKADGLAGGKGVTVAETQEKALEAVENIMEQRIYGSAGEKIVIEDKLEGEEVSILVFTDGKTILPMASSQDHKAAYDNDRGPNTGGMGAYSPAPVYTGDIHRQVIENIFKPAISGLAEQGIKFKGVLYAGLMITEVGPKVLEFNVRFGDPETQPVLYRLKSDLLEVFQAVTDEKLDKIDLAWSDWPSVCVVLASSGYPGSYEKGKVIEGLDEIEDENVYVFHAGTKVENGRVVTSGGRVLGVTAVSQNLNFAVDKAYKAVKHINFDGMQYRKDIGQKALTRMEKNS